MPWLTMILPAILRPCGVSLTGAYCVYSTRPMSASCFTAEVTEGIFTLSISAISRTWAVPLFSDSRPMASR